MLARTADDCRVAYRVLADLPAEAGSPGVGVRRIGWVRPGALFETDHDIERLARAALSPVGAEIEEVELPEAAGMSEVYFAIQGSEAYAEHADRVAADAALFDPEVLDRLRLAAETAGWRYVRALRDRGRLQNEMSALLSRYDVLALPTTPLVAPPLGARTTEINGTAVSVRQAMLSMTSPFNVFGLPALSVPVGMIGSLPTGLQLVTGPGQEDLLFAVAERVGEGGH